MVFSFFVGRGRGGAGRGGATPLAHTKCTKKHGALYWPDTAPFPPRGPECPLHLKMFPVLRFAPRHSPTPNPPHQRPPQKRIRKCCVRFYWLEQSESRRAASRRPCHCVWRCCGDANVTRCCPLSHVTSVMDAEWFWSGGGGGEGGGGVKEVRRKKSITKSVGSTVPRVVGKGAACTNGKSDVRSLADE